MAVIQISKIQVRRGLQENIPQLASGEMGWSIDERRLFIGNGTLGEGAPEIGNTEILTIYSPIGAALSNIAVLETNVSILETQVASLVANAATTVSNITLTNGTVSPTNTAIILSSTTNIIEYSITNGSAYRVGSIKATQVSSTSYFQDDYSETGTTGVELSFFAFGSNAVLRYTNTTVTDAILAYYPIKTFS